MLLKYSERRVQEQKPCFETRGGKRYEVWLKEVGGKDYERKFTTSGGTGFLVDHQGIMYLVTAALKLERPCQRTFEIHAILLGQLMLTGKARGGIAGIRE